MSKDEHEKFEGYKRSKELKGEIQDRDRQIQELDGLLTEVSHRRRLIQRMDNLQTERMDLEIQLNDIVSDEKPKFLSMTSSEIEEFVKK